MTLQGSPEKRLQRAAGRLKSAATHLEHVADDEGIPVPAEVQRALATVRNWARRLGARDLEPPSPVQAEVAAIPARPRRRDEWKRGRRV